MTPQDSDLFKRTVVSEMWIASKNLLMSVGHMLIKLVHNNFADDFFYAVSPVLPKPFEELNFGPLIFSG